MASVCTRGLKVVMLLVESGFGSHSRSLGIIWCCKGLVPFAVDSARFTDVFNRSAAEVWDSVTFSIAFRFDRIVELIWRSSLIRAKTTNQKSRLY
jgi:hypothetical protein